MKKKSPEDIDSNVYHRYAPYNAEIPSLGKLSRSSEYAFYEMWESAYGGTMGLSGPKLPTPFFQMISRIFDIEVGSIVFKGKKVIASLWAELLIHPRHWFFHVHFFKDSVMPGSMMVEGALQATSILILYYKMDGVRELITRLAAKGKCVAARWFAADKISIKGQILPYSTHKILYHVRLMKAVFNKDKGGIFIADVDIYRESYKQKYKTEKEVCVGVDESQLERECIGEMRGVGMFFGYPPEDTEEIEPALEEEYRHKFDDMYLHSASRYNEYYNGE